MELQNFVSPATGWPFAQKLDQHVPLGVFDMRPYTGGMYKTAELQHYAQWVIKHLDHFGPVDFVAVTGKSGMSVAFAALTMRQFNLVTVRKGESSHGYGVEGVAPAFGRYLILDDFISSGATVKRIHDALRDEAQAHGWQEPELIGCLMYAQSWSGNWTIKDRDVPTFGGEAGMY